MSDLASRPWLRVAALWQKVNFLARGVCEGALPNYPSLTTNSRIPFILWLPFKLGSKLQVCRKAIPPPLPTGLWPNFS